MRQRPSASKEKQTNIPRNWSMKESKFVFNFRRYLILEDQYKHMESEYMQKKEKIK